MRTKQQSKKTRKATSKKHKKRSRISHDETMRISASAGRETYRLDVIPYKIYRVLRGSRRASERLTATTSEAA